MYELLSQWRSVGKTPLLSTAELRNKMGLADAEYTRIEAFKRRVLGLAIKQINDLTDITADYEQHKQGRLVTGFTFRFKYKTNEKKITANERDPHTIDAFTGQTDTESKNIPSWQLKGLSDAQIKKIGVYKQEFIDANTSKISPNDRRGYDEIFESWEPLLKDPNQVKNFKIVQDLLERKRQN